MATGNTFRVAVFAHNEEQHVLHAIESARRACGYAQDRRIYVLINGCSDGTRSVVESHAATNADVVPVLIPLGDKAHAWNIYVHHLADDSEVHFFMDGDVRCSELALCRMQQQLLSNDAFYAIAGMPLSGRKRRFYQSCIERWHLLFGNLHGVRNRQLQQLRAESVRLPVGLWGSDHLITKLFGAQSLSPMKWDRANVTYLPGVGYCFDSLRFYRPSDWRVYMSRCINYRLRSYHLAYVESLRPCDWPETVDEANRLAKHHLKHLRPGILDPVGSRLSERLARMYPYLGGSFYADHPDRGLYTVLGASSSALPDLPMRVPAIQG